MRYQVFVLASLIIISFLYVFYSLKNVENKIIAHMISNNFEAEIKYIWKNFNDSSIGNFTKLFLSYSKNQGLNLSFVCVSNVNVSIRECNLDVTGNCCYYYDQNENIDLSSVNWECDSNKILTPYKDWLCICYTIGTAKEHITKLFCV